MPSHSGGTLHSESGVSAFDGSPYVLLTWGHENGQLSPDEARQLGLRIIACAVAAEHDAAAFAEILTVADGNRQAAAGFLRSLRNRISPGETT